MIRAAILFLLASLAQAQSFNVQPPLVSIAIVCPSGSATAKGNTYTCPGSVIPQCPSPPGPGPCVPPGSVFIGDIPLNGAQINTNGVLKTTPFFYGRVVIPFGQDGKTFSVSVLANGSGGSNAWKKVVFTKSPGDFSNQNPPVFSQGQTASVYAIINGSAINAVPVKPGEIWYFSVEYQLPFSTQPSCTQTDCDAGVRGYPPS